MQQMTNEVHNEPAIEGESVILPGDKEIQEAKIRMENGIPLDDATVDAFNKMSEKYNIPIEYIV
jgi:LDH2 family malate/lactate/ureidoglycolate dehydrogenase